MKMEKKLVLPIIALLCMTLVVSAAPAKAQYNILGIGTWTITACGVGCRLSAFVSGSASGSYVFSESAEDPSYWLSVQVTSGSARALYYDGQWHRTSAYLTGTLGFPITVSGNKWITTDPGAITFTVTWNSGHTSATISGRIYLPVDGIGTVTVCIKGTATYTPIS
jgi:hypothetical protein